MKVFQGMEGIFENLGCIYLVEIYKRSLSRRMKAFCLLDQSIVFYRVKNSSHGVDK
jgi:hypothetical protein